VTTIVVPRERRKTATGGRRGSPLSDTILPVALTVILLTGIVLMVGGAVDSRDTGMERDVAREGERLLDSLEVMIRGARWIDVEEKPEGVLLTGGRCATLDLLEDLDDDRSTGCFEADGSTGLERVFIFRPGEESRRLLARVYSSPDLPPREVELTDLLDGSDPVAFNVEYLSDARRGTVVTGEVAVSTEAPGITADGLRVSVTIREKDVFSTSTRTIGFQ